MNFYRARTERKGPKDCPRQCGRPEQKFIFLQWRKKNEFLQSPHRAERPKGLSATMRATGTKIHFPPVEEEK